MGEGEWELQAFMEWISHGNKRHSIGNIVNDTVVALCGHGTLVGSVA